MLHLTILAYLASISTIFATFKKAQLGEKIAFGLISSLIRCTANISDKDIWWREVHNSRLPSLLPEMFSLDSFRQHAHLDKLRMRCLHAGCRKAGRHKHTHKLLEPDIEESDISVET